MQSHLHVYRICLKSNAWPNSGNLGTRLEALKFCSLPELRLGSKATEFYAIGFLETSELSNQHLIFALKSFFLCVHDYVGMQQK